jgi:hypothetical protein
VTVSIENVQADLAANLEEVKNLSALSSVGDIVNHLKNTLWPFTENVVRELAEMDESLRDMYEGSEDTLQYESGKQLAAVVAGAMSLVADLERRAASEPQVLAAIKEWKSAAKGAIELLEEITLPEDEIDEVDDEDEVDDDDDEDDESDKKEPAQ